VGPDCRDRSPYVPPGGAIDLRDVEHGTVGCADETVGADACERDATPRPFGQVDDEEVAMCGVPPLRVSALLSRKGGDFWVGVKRREVGGLDSKPGVDALRAGVGAAERRIQLQPGGGEPERERLGRGWRQRSGIWHPEFGSEVPVEVLCPVEQQRRLSARLLERAEAPGLPFRGSCHAG